MRKKGEQGRRIINDKNEAWHIIIQITCREREREKEKESNSFRLQRRGSAVEKLNPPLQMSV